MTDILAGKYQIV